MTSKTLAQLVADLGVERSHSRPHVSDDNPFSESQFKTIKYSPGFPDRFGSPEHAREVSRVLFNWYNHEHHHSGLGLHTPADVHFGRAPLIQLERARVLEAAYAAVLASGGPRRGRTALPPPPLLLVGSGVPASGQREPVS